MAGALRVLILNERDSEHPRAGGAEVHVQEIFSRLAARGTEVTQASSSFPGAAPRADLGGVRVQRLGRLRAYYPRVTWLCARETRRGRFDVVVECLNKLPFYAPLYSASPVLALAHHLFGETAFYQVRWPIAAAVWSMERMLPTLYRRTPFVSISESTRQDLVRRGVDPDRVRVVHCGIRRPMLEPPPIPARPRRVAFVGRLEPYKRVDLLLRAMVHVRERVPEAELVVIGRGADRGRLERIAAELGIAHCTRFAGFVGDDERDRLLAEARVSACPSKKEGWGLTVIESNALGTPVVATDVPGLRDSVHHGKTGFLVPDGDLRALAERLAAVLSDDTLATTLSSEALRWSQRFDWERAAEEMAGALESARRRR